jgi:hypothetical protein
MEEEHAFDTPEEAAVADFPPRYVRVEDVQYHDDGNCATVTLMTNEEPYLYPYYYVYCERDAFGRWSETHSSN